MDTAAVRRLEAAACRRDGVVLWREVTRSGLSSRDVRLLVTAGAWAPLLRGAYAVGPAAYPGPAAGLRSRGRAAVLTVHDAVLGLSSAARLHGLQGGHDDGDVHVVVPPGREIARRSGLCPHPRALAPGDVVLLDGLPVTSLQRTLVDWVPRLSRPDALAVLDSALRQGATPADLAVAERRTAGRRGCCHVRDLWSLADARAESPLESRARLRCVDGGVPPTDLQLLVSSPDGVVMARVDLGFRRRDPRNLPLLLEADGQGVHAAPEALYRDRARANALVAMGYRLLRCTWADTVRSGTVPAMVRGAL